MKDCLTKCKISLCRKEWVKRQKIVHSYGEELEDSGSDLEEELQHHVSTNNVPHSLPAMQDTMPDGVDFVVGGKRCKCGSSTHQRTSHHDCPLRSTPQSTSTQENTTGAAQVRRCKCGSSTHQRTSHHDCPLRKPPKT